MTRMTTRPSAAKISAALFTTALVGLAAPASAHVNVSSTDAAQGGFGKATFRVPTESDTASTTKLVITLPQETPFAFVTAQSKPGWKASIKEEKLDQPTKVGDYELTKAVRTITWTSTDDGIPPSEFDEFALSGGPFPEAESISFSAEQTYSDGEVVSWDQVQKGDTEPEHPAPTLALSEPVEGSGHDDSVKDTSGEAQASTDENSDLGTWLGGGALVVAAAALVVTLRQNRRRA